MAMPKLATLSLSLVLAIVSIEATKYQFQDMKGMKQTNLVFFMHNWEKGLKISAIPVVGVPGKELKPTNFGTIVAIDNDLTVAYDRSSTQIGRARGMYVNSALDGTDLHVLMSLVFTSKELNGSTLVIQGSDRFYEKRREVSVVSGTGKFRLARGYAVMETALHDRINRNAIVKLSVTVFHF